MQDSFQGSYSEQGGYLVLRNGVSFAGDSGFRPEQDFSFGYTGGGCQKLAFEMIFSSTQDAILAKKALHDFTEDIIQELPSTPIGWTLRFEEIRYYLAEWGTGRRMSHDQLRYYFDQGAGSRKTGLSG